MKNFNKEIGIVKLVQIQPNGLIFSGKDGDYYDPTRRIEVDNIIISSMGVEAKLANGEICLDIHHIDHPDKKYDNRDLISIGFTSHYKAMRLRMGEHLVDGSAGENIIIEFDKEIWSEDLGEHVQIDNKNTGHRILLDFVSYAKPCREFSHFANQNHSGKIPAKELKETLNFLNYGRRGFLYLLNKDLKHEIVNVGDRVYAK